MIMIEFGVLALISVLERASTEAPTTGSQCGQFRELSSTESMLIGFCFRTCYNRSAHNW